MSFVIHVERPSETSISAEPRVPPAPPFMVSVSGLVRDWSSHVSVSLSDSSDRSSSLVSSCAEVTEMPGAGLLDGQESSQVLRRVVGEVLVDWTGSPVGDEEARTPCSQT